MNLQVLSRWRRLASCWLLMASLSASSELVALTPFGADYDVFEDGKRIGAARLDLVRKGADRWVFSTVTEGQGGMAGFLGATIAETSELQLDATGQLRTVDYRFSQEVAWNDRNRTLQIDPVSGKAHETDRKKKTWDYVTRGPVLDRHAVVLAVSMDLAAGGKAGAHAVAHKGEVEEWTFAQGGEERVNTDLGSMPAVRLERIRDNKDRRTVSWHAARWKFLPVVIEQVEPDGTSYRMVLRRFRQAP